MVDTSALTVAFADVASALQRLATSMLQEDMAAITAYIHAQRQTLETLQQETQEQTQTYAQTLQTWLRDRTESAAAWVHEHEEQVAARFQASEATTATHLATIEARLQTLQSMDIVTLVRRIVQIDLGITPQRILVETGLDRETLLTEIRTLADRVIQRTLATLPLDALVQQALTAQLKAHQSELRVLLQQTMRQLLQEQLAADLQASSSGTATA